VMEQAAAPLIEAWRKSPLGESARGAAIARRIARTARRAGRSILSQFEESHFVPMQYEMVFGKNGAAPITLELADGTFIYLQGRIDRIDRWNAGDRTWLRIIDYKSGMSELNLTRLYFGLQLQLIIYLAVALERDACRPAGAFYFKVADPVVSTEERDADKVDMMRSDELRLSGLFINNREVLDAMSPDIEHTVQLTLKTDGTVSSNVRMVDESGFQLLIAHALDAATRIADGIQQGKTEVDPVRMSGYCSCDRCDWRALCQQDPRLGGMPRTLPSIRQSDVLAEILAERTAEN